MVSSGPSNDFAVQDINVDREGRVTITNPGIAGRLHAAATKRRVREAPNTNCQGCNAVAGCGESNSLCPVNTVKSCGGTKVK
jgi:hypothetical protein